MKKHVALAAVAASAFVATPAVAATTLHVNFTGIFSDGPSPLSGTVDYNFDNGVFTFLGSSFNNGSTTITESFARIYYGSTEDLLLIGTYDPSIITGYDQYTLTLNINPDTGLPFNDGDQSLIYSGVGLSTYYGTTNLQYDTGAVPEPATWAMMLLGFGGIGFAMRRKRTPVLARA